MPQPVVAFESNEPVEVALHYPAGRVINTRLGDRVMYSLDLPAEHVMFLDLAVGQRINVLAPKPGERLFICKRGKGKNAKWDLWLSPEAEKIRAAREAGVQVKENGRPDWGGIPETDLEGEMRRAKETGAVSRPAPAAPAATRTPSQGTSNAYSANGSAGWTQTLLAQANALTDVFAAALLHARKHGDAVGPEDVRTFVVAAFSNLSKGGAR